MRQRMSRFTPLAVLATVAALTAILTFEIVRALPVPHRTDGLRSVTPSVSPPESLHRVLHALADRALTKPKLTYGSDTASRIRITYDTDFSIGGVIYRKAATDNIASSVSTGTALTSTQAAIFRVEIDDTGAVTTVQGPIVTLASADPPVPQRSACARASSPMIGPSARRRSAGFT